jgi:hypothetical protein
MPANEILIEAGKLYKVSDSLDALAEKHAPVADALFTVSGNVRNTANLLQVLVAMRLGSPSELNSVYN